MLQQIHDLLIMPDTLRAVIQGLLQVTVYSEKSPEDALNYGIVDEIIDYTAASEPNGEKQKK